MLLSVLPSEGNIASVKKKERKKKHTTSSKNTA